jgi:hypothetical protein
MRRSEKAIAVQLDRPGISVVLVLAGLVAVTNVTATIVTLAMA